MAVGDALDAGGEAQDEESGEAYGSGGFSLLGALVGLSIGGVFLATQVFGGSDSPTASSSGAVEDYSDSYSSTSSSYEEPTSTSSEAFEFGRDVADAYYWEYHPSWVQGGDTPRQWCSSWALQWYQIDYGYLQSDVRDEVRAGCVAQAGTFDYWNR